MHEHQFDGDKEAAVNTRDWFMAGYLVMKINAAAIRPRDINVQADEALHHG